MTNKTKEYIQIKRPVAVDLFAGVGGMSLGFEAAGFDVFLAVELDPIHCVTHKFNFPQANVICSDISKIRSGVLKEYLSGNDLDLLIGGPPCQGFSQIGYRQLEDSRNRLVFEFCRIVKDLQPKYFVFENVPGMNTGRQQKFVAELIAEFDEAGYNVTFPFRVLNAAEFDVPQSRKRFILLGNRRDCPKATYPTPTCCFTTDGQMQLIGDAHPAISVSDAISDLEQHIPFIGADTGISSTQLNYKDYRKNFSFEDRGLFNLCHKRTFQENLVFGHLVSNHTNASIRRFEETTPGTTESISRFFKLHPQKLCNTLRAGTDTQRGAHTAARPIHYKFPRCISVREGARLHSYPDWFQFHGTIWHGFRQIGNSVAPLFAKCLGDAVIQAMGIDSKKLPTSILSPSPNEYLSFNMGQACAYLGVSNPIPKRIRKAAANAQQV